jgi:hypothetical protein
MAVDQSTHVLLPSFLPARLNLYIQEWEIDQIPTLLVIIIPGLWLQARLYLNLHFLNNKVMLRLINKATLVGMGVRAVQVIVRVWFREKHLQSVRLDIQDGKI